MTNEQPNNLIAILGGTFDPVHNAHLEIAQACLSALAMKKILFIPCMQQVLKANTPHASAAQRVEMLQLALAEQSVCEIDQREILRDTPSYMIDTLQSIRSEHPHTPLALILGMDTFAQLPQWHQWHQLIKLAHIIVINRPEYSLPKAMQRYVDTYQCDEPEELLTCPAGDITFLTMEPSTISATDIRANLAANQEVSPLIPEEVLAYIKNNHLYQDL